MTHVFGCSLAVPRIKAASALVAPSLHHLSVSHQARKAKIVQFRSDFFIQSYGPRSVMASSPDSHAGGPGFKSWCRPTNFRPVWSPSIPIPRLKSKNGKGFPEEGEVRAKGLWFRRAPREAKKKTGTNSSAVLLFKDVETNAYKYLSRCSPSFCKADPKDSSERWDRSLTGLPIILLLLYSYLQE